MKYFITSDIHSYFDEFLAAITKAGFDKNDVNHTLIICGDLFDRGPKPLELYEYLTSLVPERLILIRGNHEGILKHLVHNSCIWDYTDIINGTMRTLWDLAYGYNTQDNKQPKLCWDTFTKAQELFKASPVDAWLNSETIWRNYFELGKYIFVHSFIPYDIRRYRKDFRKIKDADSWYNATWGCPYEDYINGLFNYEEEKGKILVCGHWTVVDFHNALSSFETHFPDENIKNPYRAFISPHLIGLDACTYVSHKLNVITIDHNNKNKLEVINN